MKEATGELNMTVITIVAIAAVAGIFTLWVLPAIQNSVARQSCYAECGSGNAGCANIAKGSDGKRTWTCK